MVCTLVDLYPVPPDTPLCQPDLFEQSMALLVRNLLEKNPDRTVCEDPRLRSLLEVHTVLDM